jgi:hypothetical protein
VMRRKLVWSMVLKRGHVVLSNRRVAKRVVLMRRINVLREIHVVRRHRCAERRVADRLKFVPEMGFVVRRVNIWMRGFVVMPTRATVREFVVLGRVLLIRDVCLPRVGVRKLEGLGLVLLLGIVGPGRLVPTAVVLRRQSKVRHQ